MARSPFVSALAASAVLALACACAEVPAGAAPAKPRKAEPVMNPCDTFYGADFALKRVSTDAAAKAPAAIAKPAKGAIVSDPDFRTCIVRATAHDDDPPKTFARNDYSRREAFNADGTRFLAYAMDGYWHLYDARTLKWLTQLKGPAGDAEPQWDHADPNVFYYVPTNGGTKLLRMHLDTGASDVAADFLPALPKWAAKAEHIWMKSEGSPSKDERYWGFQVEDAKFNILGFIVWDLVEKRLVGSRQETVERPHNLSMSPTGRWFIVAGSPTSPTWAFSPDFKTKKKLHHRVEHADTAILANGHDAYVSVDYESRRAPVFFTDIDACEPVPADAKDAPVCPRTTLFDLYGNGYATALHLSGKAYRKPGWLLVSTYDLVNSRPNPPAPPWYKDAIFAVELAASPRIFALGPHHSTVQGCYWAEPQATVDRDFTRILFNSDWDKGETCADADRAAARDVDAYMMTLPANALPDAR
jgi:hypothetical protein